jgi:hypothetical protein
MLDQVCACGWFHGVIAPTTPTGSRRTIVCPSMLGLISSSSASTITSA